MFKSLTAKIKMTAASQSSVIHRASAGPGTNMGVGVGTGLPLTYPLSPSESAESVLFPVKGGEQASVESTLLEKIALLDPAYDECSPFYVCDVGEVRRQLRLWRSLLPFVQPYYAVKCNPSRGFLGALAQLGVGFDCASQNEIRAVFEAHEALGASVDTKRLIYANPIKPISHLRFAHSHNVGLTTVDSLEEVEKIARYAAGMDVLVRITTDDSSAQCPLSVKFGADVPYSTKIVDRCVELGVHVRGVAFHAGSGFEDASTLSKAVQDARTVWDYANGRQFARCDMLDVGGGFSKDGFVEPARVLGGEIGRLFSDELASGEMSVISELGRFLSASCFTLATNVIGTRREASADGASAAKDDKIRVYLNDGLYGNLNCILYDHQEVEPVVITSAGRFVYGEDTPVSTESGTRQYSIWGPTCDGLDCIKKRCLLSHDVHCGDWVGFRNAGAYTSAAATSFNGFANEFECVFIDTEI